jgi:hypothetical protein
VGAHVHAEESDADADADADGAVDGARSPVGGQQFGAVSAARAA